MVERGKLCKPIDTRFILFGSMSLQTRKAYFLTCSGAQCPEPTWCCSPPNTMSRLPRYRRTPIVADDAMIPRMSCILVASAPVWSSSPAKRHLSKMAGLQEGLLSHLDYSSFSALRLRESSLLQQKNSVSLFKHNFNIFQNAKKIGQFNEYFYLHQVPYKMQHHELFVVSWEKTYFDTNGFPYIAITSVRRHPNFTQLAFLC